MPYKETGLKGYTRILSFKKKKEKNNLKINCVQNVINRK